MQTMQAPDNNEQSLLNNDIHIQATYRLTEALVASEKKMRRRIELLSEIVFETTPDGCLTFLNPAWKTALDYEPGSSLGAPLASFVVEDDQPLLHQALHHFAVRADARTGQSRPEVRFRRRDGGVVWMELSVAARDEGGAVGILHNVTRQKAAQAELAKLSLVASFTDNLVIIADCEGRVEWVNDAFIRKTGYTLAEVVARKPGELLQGPRSDPATVETIRQRLREGRSFQCEILNYTKAREEYWVAVHISPILDATGKVERFVSIQNDITELRRTQTDLKAAKEAAESASDAKTHFLATISHEMRTPLNVILGSVELARTETALAEYPTHLKRIDENAETLLGLISDLLDVSKIEAGQFEWDRSAFALRPHLETALIPLAERAVRKGLSFHLNFAPDLPTRILDDPTRIRQIVMNLAENALKFTDAGFIAIDIIRRQNRLGISVTDSGTGISLAARPHLFDRFFQGDSSTTRRKGGAGLGLSIVKSLVDALGGEINVESVPGQGSRFEVTLPLVAVESEQADPTELQPAAGAVVAASPGSRILIVEDHDVNYAILERHLTRNGYSVTRAENGSLAVEAAARQNYNLILMDLEMPEMDGLEATRQIRLHETLSGTPRIPIVAVTAHALLGYREKCLQSGCTGYMAKPVRKDILLATVATALSASPQAATA